MFRPSIDVKLLSTHFLSDNWDGLVDVVVNWLSDFSKLKFIQEFSPSQRSSVTDSLDAVAFYLGRHQGGSLKRQTIHRLVSHLPTISNLFALSEFRSAETFLMRSRTIGIRELAFWGPRVSLPPDRDQFLDLDPALGSVWYGQYLFAVRAFPSRIVAANLRAHLDYWSSRMTLHPTLSNGYMRSTYLGLDYDRRWKSRFNELVKSKFSQLIISNQPDPTQIAIVTARWAKVHPTYKNRYPLFKRLAERYKLTLVHVGADRSDLETDLFDRVISTKFVGSNLELGELKDNKFGAVFYPDIGMNVESRFLSNIRLAPVQLTTNSHPVSTFGSEIDYFVTGIESESDVTIAPKYYSERLVLIPGIGTRPVVPDVVRKTRDISSRLHQGETVRIACPWGGLKINPELIDNLKSIIKRTLRPVCFRFLVTLGQDGGHFHSIRQDLIDELGLNHVEVFADKPYPEYMALLEDCSFALDAFPFGGNTSIVDCMYLKRPIICRAGWQFYNLAGPVILRKAGLANLVANSDLEYVNKALELVDPQSTLNQETNDKLDKVDIRELLNSLSDESSFEKMFDVLLAKKSKFPQGHQPIIID